MNSLFFQKILRVPENHLPFVSERTVIHVALAFVGFGLFNLLRNFGPNATTFLLPAELFSTSLHATAHGFAAGLAKLGAACGIIGVPLMTASYGVWKNRETGKAYQKQVFDC